MKKIITRDRNKGEGGQGLEAIDVVNFGSRA